MFGVCLFSWTWNGIQANLTHPLDCIFPFLLFDLVVECKPSVPIVAIKNVTINDNFFIGHFPERPIMLGVLMVEVIIF